MECRSVSPCWKKQKHKKPLGCSQSVSEATEEVCDECRLVKQTNLRNRLMAYRICGGGEGLKKRLHDTSRFDYALFTQSMLCRQYLCRLGWWDEKSSALLLHIKVHFYAPSPPIKKMNEKTTKERFALNCVSCHSRQVGKFNSVYFCIGEIVLIPSSDFFLCRTTSGYNKTFLPHHRPLQVP